MSIIEIADDLFFIERGYLNANHFVYRSPSPILIDTGYKRDFAETKRFLDHLGVKLGDVRLIINTHTHCDHVGGNRIIQERFAGLNLLLLFFLWYNIALDLSVTLQPRLPRQARSI